MSLLNPTIDDLHTTAIDALHAWHHACIRQAADDIREDVRRGVITDQDEATEAIEQWAESLCTYTFNAQLHLTASRHDDAFFDYEDRDGVANHDSVKWERLAYYALEADIRDQLGDAVETLLAASDAAGDDVL